MIVSPVYPGLQLIHLTHVTKVYYVPDTVLDSGNTVLYHIDKYPALGDLIR